MYLEHYGLKLKPFNISPDPQFLWLGERHREALATLRYGIQENKGFLLLTGDVGTGKTVLINRLIKLIDVKVIVATIPDPGLGLVDFYNILADEFKMGREFNQKGEFLIHFKKFLIKAYGAQKSVLLIIDEAQRLEHGLLDEVRVLSNIDFNGSKLINIFLVGQSELRKMLLEERNRPFRQRISVNYNIEPLNEKDTAAFIQHRLKVAGAARRYFTADAMREVHAFSNGFPRLINVMCDHALMSGYSAGLAMIDGGTIRECAKELQITVEPAAPLLKEKVPVEYRPLPQQPKIDEYIEEPEIPPKTSFVRIAGYIVIFIIFVGVILSLLSPSQLEQSPNLARHDNETAIEESSTDKDEEQPTEFVDSEGSTKDTPVEISPSEKIIVAKNTEKVVVVQKQLDKDLKEIKTDTISQDEASKNQLSEKELTGDKQSNIEDAETPTVEELTGDKQSNIEDAETPIVEELTGDKQSNIEDTETPVVKELTDEKLSRVVDDAETPVVQEANQSSKSEKEQLALMLPDKKFLIYFRRDSTEIAGQDFATLAKITEYLSRNSDSEIIVEGYTDLYGNYFYNQKLSQMRANMVKSYFVGQGITNSRINAIGLGPENPIANNQPREGRKKNRRVEIRLKPVDPE